MGTRRLCGVALLLVLAWVLGSGAASADDEPRRRGWGRSSDEAKGEDRAWDFEYTISPRTAKRLVEAREYLLAERYDDAEKALDKLSLKRLNPRERAQTLRIYAFIAYGRDDLAKAREEFEATIASGGLAPEDAADVRYQIAQLWMQEENWSEAAKNLELWFDQVETPNAAAYYTLALVYYQLEDFDSALPAAEKAVEMTEDPRESWLQLLLAVRLLRKEYQEAVPILERLVRSYPKKSYWMNLSTLYGALGDYEEALVHLELAYRQGLLTEDAELRRLAQLLLFRELPYRAARVLEKGLKDGVIEADVEAWEMLSNCWIAAREYDEAVSPLEKAGALAQNGEIYVRLAQVHLQREKWAEAATALRKALQKGDLEKPADAELLMGISFYSRKQPEQARTWFARASRDETTRAEAQAWLQYLDREFPTS